MVEASYKGEGSLMPYESEQQIDQIILGLKGLYSKLASSRKQHLA